jgi:hypothetical protein
MNEPINDDDIRLDLLYNLLQLRLTVLELVKREAPCWKKEL